MLINFFLALKDAGLPVSLKELLALLEALKARVVFACLDDFYILSRLILIKDEKYYDRFDRAFSQYFEHIDASEITFETLIPEEWVKSLVDKPLTEEQKKQIESLGGLDKLLEAFKERLKEQKKRHQGGNKWIGTGGTSPFGNGGYNPEGIRVGGEGGNKKALKVWEQRRFKNLDDSVELGTRNIKVALKKLRKFARSGAADQLDLDDTISSTARNGGLLDIKMVPERHNAVKVLLFFDVGGSMDPYVSICEELFSACRSEFKHLEYFYFHNFLYDHVWKNNQRRMTELTPTFDVLHTYGRDYKVVFVGDASMSPYEITSPYGSVEHMNEEPGAKWMERLTTAFDKVVWFNPSEIRFWEYTQSIGMVKQMMDGHMYPLTLEGLDRGIKFLRAR